MRLFYSPFHTFVHKSLVVAHDAGLWEAITFVPTYPFKNRNGEDQGDRYSIAAINPLNKVPTLALDSGQVVYGSQAVVEYLDAHRRTGTRLYPADGPARWDALTRLALADTMFESTVVLVMEGWQPEDEQRIGTFEWIWPKLIRGLDELERACRRGFAAFDIGHVGMLQMISYLDFRAKFYKARDLLHPEYDWAAGRGALKTWFDAAITRPSVQSHYFRDFEGDDSAAFLQSNVDAVLAARRRNGL